MNGEYNDDRIDFHEMTLDELLVLAAEFRVMLNRVEKRITILDEAATPIERAFFEVARDHIDPERFEELFAKAKQRIE